MAEHLLWSFNNALFFIILVIIIIIVIIFGLSSIFDVKNIKDNWAKYRCSPMIMPFAGLFGHNAKENMEFCMGKIFSAHSASYMGSVGTMFSQSSNLLQMILGSMDSMRNTVATLGGGINVVFQEFTDRISNFFFRLRVSAIYIKSLIGRMYAILFSVMYMGMSGITGMTSFTNTFLFSFLDTFCFPGNTEIMVQGKGMTPIKDIQMGDILLPSDSKVTATFQFYSKGQPMVQLGSTIVSTNHYVFHQDKLIMAGEHPHAIHIGGWNSDEPLYCLNTTNNKIPIANLTFLDYDETTKADEITMKFIEERINAQKASHCYPFTEYCPAIAEDAMIKTIHGSKQAKDIQIGDKLVTGSQVVGLIRRLVQEVSMLEDGTIVTPSTLCWHDNKWQRVGTFTEVKKETMELVSFVVIPNSQLELENGTRIRDYMELCSPDSEMHYSDHLESKNVEDTVVGKPQND
jgi:hypothetical protein